MSRDAERIAEALLIALTVVPTAGGQAPGLSGAIQRLLDDGTIGPGNAQNEGAESD